MWYSWEILLSISKSAFVDKCLFPCMLFCFLLGCPLSPLRVSRPTIRPTVALMIEPSEFIFMKVPHIQRTSLVKYVKRKQ